MKDPKKKEYTYYWEEPEKKISFEDALKPVELNFTFPKIGISNIRSGLDISDRNDYFVIKTILPGFKASDIKLNISKNSIELIAKKSEKRVRGNERSYMNQTSSSVVHNSFSLPSDIDPKNVHAKLENSVLIIILPKIDEKKKLKKTN